MQFVGAALTGGTGFMATTTTVEPTQEPVTLVDMKAHLRVDGNEEDDLLRGYVVAARRLAETITKRRFITQTIRVDLDGFPDGEIVIHESPLQSVSSITYTDTSGNSQTLSSSLYQVNARTEPGRIAPAYQQIWPSTRCDDYNAVTVTAVVGYGATPDTVPQGIRLAIKLLAANFYENREPVAVGTVVNEIPLALEPLLWQHRVMELA